MTDWNNKNEVFKFINPKEGVNTEYYPNGTVKSIGEWADNDFSESIRIGEHKYFHSNGQLELIQRFKKNNWQSVITN